MVVGHIVVNSAAELWSTQQRRTSLPLPIEATKVSKEEKILPDGEKNIIFHLPHGQKKVQKVFYLKERAPL